MLTLQEKFLTRGSLRAQFVSDKPPELQREVLSTGWWVTHIDPLMVCFDTKQVFNYQPLQIGRDVYLQ